MKREVLQGSGTRTPMAHYCQGVRVGETVYAAGQIASDYKTGVPPEARQDPAFPYYGSDIQKQTRYVLENLRSMFQADARHPEMTKSQIGRRQFLAAVAALPCVPLTARAQKVKKVYRVGYIITTTPVAKVRSDPTHPLTSFTQEMRARGYVEGDNLVLELRSLEGRLDQAAEMAAQMVRLKVDVIFATQNSVIRDIKRVTTRTPIVMTSGDAPVEEGLIASLARPSGNVTGLSLEPSHDIYRKRLQLLKEAFPTMSRVAFVGRRTNWEKEQGQTLRAAARQLGVNMFLAEVSSNDYAEAFRVITNERIDALLIGGDSQNYVYRAVIARFASEKRLPAIYPNRESAEAGGLIAYGVDVRDLFRRTAIYVDKILTGAKPSELAVEQPTKFELVLNMKTAKAMGLKIPQSVVLRADHLIE